MSGQAIEGAKRTIEDAELLVVGAGPAGSAAAITARDLGLDVVVVDRATFPRDKTCGDGLTAGALRLLEGLGLDLPGLEGYAPVRDCVVVGPGGRAISLPLPGTGAYAGVVRRTRLDAALVALAETRGAHVRVGCALEGLDVRDGGVVAELADGREVRAPWVVAADGHYSTVRRLLQPGAPPVLGEWSAFRQYFRCVEDRRLWVLFERDLLPGYAWVFPLPDGRANVGFGMVRRPGVTGKTLKARWTQLLERPRMRAVLGASAVPEAPHRAWPIPTRLDTHPLGGGRVLLAGDAAGAVDPMTGEGIAQALLSGSLAVRAIAGGGSVAAVGARYRHALDRGIGRDARFAVRLQRVLRSSFGARTAVAVAGLTPWTRRNFARWMFEDYPRALVLTPDRWGRSMFSPEAAYPGT